MQTATRWLGRSTSTLTTLACDRSRAHGGRDYQQALASDVIGALEAHIPGRASRAIASSALVIVPTGGGKTHIALSIAATLQGAGLRVGWCAARRELLRQVDGENQRFGFGVDLRLVSMFDRSPPPCDCLIMDEAHHDACVSSANLTAAMAPSYVIGLTATPYRTDQARLAYNHVLRRCSIQSLQDDGYLSQYRHVTIDSWAPEAVATTWLAHPNEFGKSVMFFRTAHEGERCIAYLRAGGVACELVTGSTDRDDQIARLGGGELHVLVAMACLTEGFNDPSLGTVFVRPASRGPTVQMAGRVLRIHPDIPLKTIVQYQRTPYPFPRLARPREQFVLTDGVWRAVGANRQLDRLVRSMRMIAAKRVPALPQFFCAVRTLRRERFGRYSSDRPDQEN